MSARRDPYQFGSLTATLCRLVIGTPRDYLAPSSGDTAIRLWRNAQTESAFCQRVGLWRLWLSDILHAAGAEPARDMSGVAAKPRFEVLTPAPRDAETGQDGQIAQLRGHHAKQGFPR